MSSTDSSRGVAAAGRPDFERAAFEGLARAAAAEAAQRAAAERIGRARAALVEHQQIARPERRGECLGDEFAERQRRLAGSAGERDHGGLALCETGLFALEAQRERAGREAGTADWDRHGGAIEADGGGAGAGDEAQRPGRGDAEEGRQAHRERRRQ